MKILHLSNYYPPFYEGSTEIQTYQLVQELERRGNHKQQVLTSDFTPVGQSSESSDVFRQIQIADHIERQQSVFRDLHIHPGYSGNLGPAGSGHESFWRLYRRERYNVEVLRRRLERFGPDLIFVWGFQGLSGAMLFYIENCGIPCAYGIINDWPTVWLKNEPWLDTWRGYSRGSDSVIKPMLEGLHLSEFIRKKAPFGEPANICLQRSFFCSGSLKKAAGRDGFEVSHSEVIPCAVPVERYYRKENHPPRLRHLLYIGRLNEEKDPLTALQALQILHRKGHTEFTLDLHRHGNLEHEKRLLAYIVRSNLRGAVRFTQTVQEQQHVTLYSYDMLISTSKWPEPFPLMQLKGMAAGLPVVTTLVGGHAELIRDRENALAFKTSDPKDLAEKILELSENPDLVKKLTSTAYEEVCSKFSLSCIGERVDYFISASQKVAAC